MKNLNASPKRFLAPIIALALALSICAGSLMNLPSHAQGKGSKPPSPPEVVDPASKIADDVKEKLSTLSSSDLICILVSFSGKPKGKLNAFLNQNGVHLKGNFDSLDQMALDVPASMVMQLANYDQVEFISLDHQTKAMGEMSLTTGADTVNKPKYDATALGYVPSSGGGKDIGIAFIDSGIDSGHYSMKVWAKDSNNNWGWRNRVIAKVDFTGENKPDQDPYGHGTHVATIAAGSGRIANGAYMGIAPLVDIINLRVLDGTGQGQVSSVLSALNWILSPSDPNKPWDKVYNPYNKDKYNIDVVNMSIGTPAINSYKDDPLCKAVRRLVNAGIVVVAAAGNNGKDENGNKVYGRIHSPGNEPSAITVGASNAMGTDGPLDDRVTTYSSRGPTRSYSVDADGNKHYDNQIKPDLVAPGNKIIAAESDYQDIYTNRNYLVTHNPQLDAGVSAQNDRKMMWLSGTSMSTPAVAGAAALLLQAAPKMTPNMVKMVLMYTAQPLNGYNMFEQGAGQLNIEGAMRLVKALKTDIKQDSPVGTVFTKQTTTVTDKKTGIKTTYPVLPTPQTTTAGQTFTWAQGIIIGRTYATGTNLVAKWQPIYALGAVLGDGIMVSDGIMVADGIMVSDGVVLGDGIMVSDGGVMGSGYYFMSTGILVSDGIMVTDGGAFGDGIMVSDGVVLGDGIMVSDNVRAQQAMVEGDPTACMPVVIDPGL
jgi:serine protease AprX